MIWQRVALFNSLIALLILIYSFYIDKIVKPQHHYIYGRNALNVALCRNVSKN